MCFYQRSPSPNLHRCLSETLHQVNQPRKNISFADFENLGGKKPKLNERSGKVAAALQQIPPNTAEHFAEP